MTFEIAVRILRIICSLLDYLLNFLISNVNSNYLWCYYFRSEIDFCNSSPSKDVNITLPHSATLIPIFSYISVDTSFLLFATKFLWLRLLLADFINIVFKRFQGVSTTNNQEKSLSKQPGDKKWGWWGALSFEARLHPYI